MIARIILLIGSVMLIISCDREPAGNPTINFSGSSACKDLGLKSGADHAEDQDCIHYTWVSGDTLKITHFNAGFNCCPEGFHTELKVSGDTLEISESENSSLCDCNCLFDLRYELTGINKDTWWIRILEQYAEQPGDEKILFKAELSKLTEGEFCVTRTKYPWRWQTQR